MGKRPRLKMSVEKLAKAVELFTQLLALAELIRHLI
jgi:hypothetical protein